jgi:hypothetical protein
MKSIKVQKWDLAAQVRDMERIKSKEIFNILNTGGEFVDWNTCDKIIDNHCNQVYNCSIYDTHSLKQIIRQKRLKDIGI